MTTPAGPRLRAAAVASAALALMLGGCTAGDDTTDDGPQPVTVRVGDSPGIPAALLRYAVERGSFAEVGLDVQLAPDPGGGSTLPRVIAGDLDIAGVDVGSLLLARGEGLPVRMISAGTFAAEEAQFDFSQVVVGADSPVRSPEDLNGRRVAVTTMPSLAEVAIRASLERAGAGHADLDFVEVRLPDMIAALQDGRVDAVHLTEPYLSVGLREGLRPILSPYAQTQPGLAVGSYVSSDEFIERHPDVVDRFVAGVHAASEHVASNPAELRTALVELSTIEPAVAATVHLPRWGGPVHMPSVDLIGDLLVGFGMLDVKLSARDVVHHP